MQTVEEKLAAKERESNAQTQAIDQKAREVLAFLFFLLYSIFIFVLTHFYCVRVTIVKENIRAPHSSVLLVEFLCRFIFTFQIFAFL